MGQLKIRIDDELLLKFKKIVLAKHKKLEISREGEEDIKLYVKKYEHLLENKIMVEKAPLKSIIGIAESDKPRSALEDLKELEAGLYSL